MSYMSISDFENPHVYVGKLKTGGYLIERCGETNTHYQASSLTAAFKIVRQIFDPPPSTEDTE